MKRNLFLILPLIGLASSCTGPSESDVDQDILAACKQCEETRMLDSLEFIFTEYTPAQIDTVRLVELDEGVVIRDSFIFPEEDTERSVYNPCSASFILTNVDLDHTFRFEVNTYSKWNGPMVSTHWIEDLHLEGCIEQTTNNRVAHCTVASSRSSNARVPVGADYVLLQSGEFWPCGTHNPVLLN